MSPHLDNAVCQQGAAIRAWRLRGIIFNVKHIPKLSLTPNKIWCLGFGAEHYRTLGNSSFYPGSALALPSSSLVSSWQKSPWFGEGSEPKLPSTPSRMLVVWFGANTFGSSSFCLLKGKRPGATLGWGYLENRKKKKDKKRCSWERIVYFMFLRGILQTMEHFKKTEWSKYLTVSLKHTHKPLDRGNHTSEEVNTAEEQLHLHSSRRKNCNGVGAKKCHPGIKIRTRCSANARTCRKQSASNNTPSTYCRINLFTWYKWN